MWESSERTVTYAAIKDGIFNISSGWLTLDKNEPKNSKIYI